jgi:hypothetical protein
MTLSIIEIQGAATTEPTEKKYATLRKTVFPPKILMGKECTCEMTAASWSPKTPLLEATEASLFDSYLFSIDLNQLWSKKYTENTYERSVPDGSGGTTTVYTVDQHETFQPTLGVFQPLTGFKSTGPTIVRVPDGPFSVVLRVDKFSGFNTKVSKTVDPHYDQLMCTLAFSPVE